MFGFQTLQHVLRMTRTWDSTMSLLLKGGETIWGGLDWSPEEDHECSLKKKNNYDQTVDNNRTLDLAIFNHTNYGRLLSFGKGFADLNSSEIESADFKVTFRLFTCFFEMPFGPILIYFNGFNDLIG